MNLLNRDAESYPAIKDTFAYWDDIIIRYRGRDDPLQRQRLCGVLSSGVAEYLAESLRRGRRRDSLPNAGR